MGGEFGRGAADGDHGSALLDEFLEPGQGALDAGPAELTAILRRQIGGVGLRRPPPSAAPPPPVNAAGSVRPPPAPPPPPAAARRPRYPACHEDQDVVFRMQAARI